MKNLLRKQKIKKIKKKNQIKISKTEVYNKYK